MTSNRPERIKPVILDPVPAQTRAKDGDIIDTSGTVWRLPSPKKKLILNFDRLESLCTPEFINGAMWVWHTRLKQMNRAGKAGSYETLYGQFGTFMVFVRWLAGRSKRQLIDTVTLADVVNFKADNEGHLFRKLITTLRTWIDGGFHRVEPDVIDILDANNCLHDFEALEAVKVLDPMKGPLLEAEAQMYVRLLNEAYGEGRLSLDDYCLARLTFAFGQRPESTSRLRLKHVEVKMDASGQKACFLHIPWAKQKNVKHPKPYPLISDLSRAVMSLTEIVRLRFPKDSLPNGMNWDDLPLFPVRNTAEPVPIQAKELSVHLKRISHIINFVSPREGTGDGVKEVGARILRYTVGTTLAFKERLSAREIANFLIQTREESCAPYVGVAQDLLGASGFNQMYGPELKRIANRCLDIVDEDETTVPARSIIRYSEDGKHRPGVGRCGDKECFHEGPIECYVCASFRPWLRGPHKLVLNSLLRKRETLAEVDPTRACDLDHVVIRVMEVIDACESILAERGESCP